MPEFATVSLSEAQLRTATGRQGRVIAEYAPYIRELSPKQAGRLRALEGENPLTIRRRLLATAKALGIPLIVKRSGADIYFWQEGGGEEEPRRRRGATRQRPFHEEPALADQLFREPEEVEQGITEEESPELGQTE